MRLVTFASGSTGNCALLTLDGVHILLDAGISCRRICAGLSDLGLGPGDLSAVLITHALQMLALSGNLLDDGSEMIVCPPSPHSSSVASTVFR